MSSTIVTLTHTAIDPHLGYSKSLVVSLIAELPSCLISKWQHEGIPDVHPSCPMTPQLKHLEKFPLLKSGGQSIMHYTI